MDSPASLTDTTLDHIREHEGVFFSPKPKEQYFINRLNRTRHTSRLAEHTEGDAVFAPLDIRKGTDEEKTAVVEHEEPGCFSSGTTSAPIFIQQPPCEADTPLDTNMDLEQESSTVISGSPPKPPVEDLKLSEAHEMSTEPTSAVESSLVTFENTSSPVAPRTTNHTTSPNSHSPQLAHTTTIPGPDPPLPPQTSSTTFETLEPAPMLCADLLAPSETPPVTLGETSNVSSPPLPEEQDYDPELATPRPSHQAGCAPLIHDSPAALNETQPGTSPQLLSPAQTSYMATPQTPQTTRLQNVKTPRSILSSSRKDETVRRSVKRVVIVSPIMEDIDDTQPYKKLKTENQSALPISRLPVPSLQRHVASTAKSPGPNSEMSNPAAASTSGARLSLSLAADAALQSLHLDLAAEAIPPPSNTHHSTGGPSSSGTTSILTPQRRGGGVLSRALKAPKETPLRRLLFASSTTSKPSGAKKPPITTSNTPKPAAQPNSDTNSSFRFVFSAGSGSSATAAPATTITHVLSPPPLAGGFKFATEPFKSPVRAMNKQARAVTQSSPAKGLLISHLPPGRSPSRLAALSSSTMSQSTASTSLSSLPLPQAPKSSPFKESSNKFGSETSQALHSGKLAVGSLKASLGPKTKAISGTSRLPRPGFQQTKVIPPPTRVYMAHVPSVTLGGSPSKLNTHAVENEPPASSAGPRKKKLRQVVPGTMTNWEGKPKDSAPATSYDSCPSEGTHEDSSPSVKEEGPLKEIAVADAPQPNQTSEESSDSSPTPPDPTSLGSVFVESGNSPRGGVRRSRRLSSEVNECPIEENESSVPTRSRSARLKQIATTSSRPASQPDKPKTKNVTLATSNAPDPKTIAVLTSKNTKRNEQYYNNLDLQVVKMDCLRPPSPTTKVRTILEKQQASAGASKARTTRASRKDAMKSEAEESASSDTPPSSPSNPRKHTRGAGDEEDYQTPKRRRIEDRIEHGTPPIPHLDLGETNPKEQGDDKSSARSSSGSSARSAGSQGKSVRWNKKLIFDVEKGETVKLPTDTSKSCLAKGVSEQRLDIHGNILNADNPPVDVPKDKVVVIKYVYLDDEPEAAPPPPPSSPPSPKRASKRKR